MTKNKEKKHDEAKYQLNNLNMSTSFFCKKFKITFFDNDIIINHSHMLDCSWWNWNLQSKHDMFLTVDSNLEREFYSSQTQATCSNRSQQRKYEKKMNEFFEQIKSDDVISIFSTFKTIAFNEFEVIIFSDEKNENKNKNDNNNWIVNDTE